MPGLIEKIQGILVTYCFSIALALRNVCGMSDKKMDNVSLARYTSWRVGGPAEKLFIPSSIEALRHFLQHFNKNESLQILGLGSNTLVRDGGVKGSVIIFAGSGLQALEKIEPTILRAEAGVSCATLARFAARQNLGGMEFLAGIPGTVGGALAMNAGAHGSDTWSHVISVETMDRQGVRHTRLPNEFKIAYRSVDNVNDEFFIAAHFAHEISTKDSSLARIKTILAHRLATQPGNLPNGGSVFRNPPGDYAGRLIEACGLKGYRFGESSISEKHANFIVHEGKGSAQEIEHLIHLSQEGVASRFGIVLMPEVKIIGYGIHDEKIATSHRS